MNKGNNQQCWNGCEQKLPKVTENNVLVYVDV